MSSDDFGGGRERDRATLEQIFTHPQNEAEVHRFSKIAKVPAKAKAE